MTPIKGKQLTEEQRRSAINDIIYFFEKERDEKIGVIAAEQILSFFLEGIGSVLYNKGVFDARKAIENRMDELNYDLDDLMENEAV